MEKPPTELEVNFQLALPDDPNQPNDSDDDKTKTNFTVPSSQSNLFQKVSTFGVNYFIDQNEKNKLLSKLENEDNNSTLNYKFPANIEDYIYFHDPSQTKDIIALNYLREKLKFKTIEEIIHFVEHNKYDLIKMTALKAMQTNLWKLSIKENADFLNALEDCNLMTNLEMESYKRENILKSVIDEQNKKISELMASKEHSSILFNNLCYYLNSIRKMFKDVNVKVLR